MLLPIYWVLRVSHSFFFYLIENILHCIWTGQLPNKGIELCLYFLSLFIYPYEIILAMPTKGGKWHIIVPHNTQ